jgi:Phage protein Gp138 N-terminal domain
MTDKLTSIIQQLPVEGDDLADALRYAIDRSMMDIDGCLPAMVMSYDRESNTATIQPLINITTTDGTNKRRASFIKTPVISYGGGGFHINFPLAAGDLGWIVACDRDTSLMLQELSAQPAPTARTHSFSSSVFIPDAYRKYTIAGEDSAALVIQSANAQTRISVFSDKIKVTTPSSVTVTSPEIAVNGDTTMNGNLQVNGNVTITGTLDVQGMSTLSGEMNTPAASIGGIPFGTHVHSDPQVGTTGGPQ